MDEKNPLDERDEGSAMDEPPPVLRTWPRVYAFVIAYLAVLIFLFYAFTKRFEP